MTHSTTFDRVFTQGLTSKLNSLCSTLEETGLTQLDFKAAKVPLLAEDGEAIPIKKHLSQATPAQIVDLCKQRLTVSLSTSCCRLKLSCSTALWLEAALVTISGLFKAKMWLLDSSMWA